MLTIDQYFEQLVNPILSTTLPALALDPSRRYIWAEVAFFAKWWELQSPEMHGMVRRLVEQQQLEFVEGGWCQADEIVATIDGRVENLVLGHEWLRQNIAGNVTPAVGWKIDPFGAADLTPALLGTAQRWGSMVQARIPATLKEKWRESGTFQRRWSSSEPLAVRYLYSSRKRTGTSYTYQQLCKTASLMCPDTHQAPSCIAVCF